MKNIYNRIYRLLRDTKVTHVLARDGDNVYLSTPVIDDKFLGEFVHDTQLRTKLLDITSLAHNEYRIILTHLDTEIIVTHFVHPERFSVSMGQTGVLHPFDEIEVERVAGRRVDVRYYKNGNCICRYPNVSLPFADARMKDWVEQYEELGKPRRKAS